MPDLADIFILYGDEYLDLYGDDMPASHRRALWDIAQCRTEALGGHLVRCDHCSKLDYSYHSCKNRACPKCHGKDAEKWLEQRRAELLPVIYFHVVFTLPKKLRKLFRKHQKKLYGVLMKAAAEALMKLAADPKYVGGKIGMLAVLHTWTNAQAYHPHVHFLVPGGGVSPDGKLWIPSNEKFLVPVKALSPIFRAKFMEMAQDALPCAAFPRGVWEKDWVVYCKPSVQGADKVLQYLARYVHRIAITNNRILSIKTGEVTFRYKETGKRKKKRESRWRTMTLPAKEFIRRFLQHVPPKGFHKVRYYGLLSSANRPLLKQVQLLLASKTKVEDISVAGGKNEIKSPNRGIRCRFCNKGFMIDVGVLPRIWKKRLARSPP